MLEKARKQGKNPQSLGITGFSDFMDLKGIEPSEDMPTMPCLRGFLGLVSIFVSIFNSEQRVNGFDDI